MSRKFQEKVIHLIQPLFEILSNWENGIGEYDLIKQLHQQGYVHADHDVFNDNYRLYQLHFLIYHALYRLRLQLLGQAKGILEISPLRIVLNDYYRGEWALDFFDQMSTFYLDAENFDCYTPEELDGMVNNFWFFVSKRRRRKDALLALGLEEDSEHGQIKKQYRQLVMKHHPDRGGDTLVFQKINTAYRQLLED